MEDKKLMFRDDLTEIEGEKVCMIKPEGMTNEQALEFMKIMNEYGRKFYKKIDEDLAKYGEVQIKKTNISEEAC